MRRSRMQLTRCHAALQANSKYFHITLRDHRISVAEQIVSAVAPRGLGEPRDNPKPAGWERARLGVVVPLCVVVAVAIVCIIVAALTSAHRADEVALENEKHLLTRAIANHGEWSLRRLRNIIATDDIHPRYRPRRTARAGARPARPAGSSRCATTT